MDRRQSQKGMAILIVIAIIAVAGIGYLLFSSKGQKPDGNKELPGADNKILQAACKNAVNDYPQWTKNETDIVIWENPDKKFYFRNSPEDASMMLTSPVPSSETLIDMDFIGANEINYVTTSNSGWKIGTLKLNLTGSFDKSLVYEKNEVVSFLNASPINQNEFVVLIINGGKGVLKQINTQNSKEEIIVEIPSINTADLKLSVSPKGTYVYLLQNGSLILLEIASKKQTDKINAVKSAVWIGDEYVLYSDSGDPYIYNLKTKEKSKLDMIKGVTELTFNPKEDGIIAFNENGNTKIIGCQKWNIINSKQGAEFKTLTSEKTAITKKGDQIGFWRFKNNDWGVKMLEEKSKFVTVWQRY